MRMLNIYLAVFIYSNLFMLPIVNASRDKSILFHAEFDSLNVTADYAGGDPKSVSFKRPDLQLRMFKGLNNEGNALCMSNDEQLSYHMAGNFDPRQGTISLWINPQNYQVSDRFFQVYFSAATGNLQILVYKYYEDTDCMLFYVKLGEKTFAVRAQVDSNSWQPGKWHRIDAVWDSESMKIYVDGKSPGGKYASEMRFLEPLKFPRAGKQDFISFNAGKGWNPYDIKHKTAYDNLTIYNRCLSEREVKAEYEQIVPSQFNSAERLPITTIPRVITSINLDGKIDDVEWADAAIVPLMKPFYRKAIHSPLEFNTLVFVKYDDKNLYLGFKIDVPAAKNVHKDHDGDLWEDDSFEFHLLSPDGTNQYQFIVNPSGTVFDSRNADKLWESHCHAASFLGDSFWSGELTISLDRLAGLVPGAACRANFGSQKYKGNPAEANLYSWAGILDGGFASSKYFGILRFSQNGTAIRFKGLGDLASGRLDFHPEVTSSSKEQVVIRTENMNEEGVVEKDNDLLGGGRLQKQLPPGRMKFFTESRDPEGNVLLAFEHAYVVSLPLGVNYDCFPEKDNIKIKIDFRNAPETVLKRKYSTGLPIKIALAAKTDGKIYSSVSGEAKTDSDVYWLPLPKDLAEGKYVIRASCDTISAEKSFHVPDMTPFKVKIADDHAVPAPWAPVEYLGDGKFTVQDREYEFMDGPLPTRIISRGKSLLKSPPKFILKSNGQVEIFTWDQLKIDEKYSDYIVFSVTGKARNFTVNARGELWFDGMYKFNIGFNPFQKSASDHSSSIITSNHRRIDSLILSWSMENEFAQYVLTPYFQAWDQNQLKLKWSPTTDGSLLWLSGIENGLAWWCSSDANWVNPAEEKQISLMNKNGVVNVDIKIIGTPVATDASINYTMLFQATPSKRLQSDYREFKFWHGHGEPTYGGVNFPIGWSSENGIVQADNIKNWVSLIPQDPEAFSKYLKNLKMHDLTPFLYSQPTRLTKNDAEYEYFFKLWATTASPASYKDPVTGEFRYSEACCGNTGITDLQAYRLNRLFQEQPLLAGVYYDLCALEYCSNERHGCGGVDAFGHKYGTSTALNLRNYMIRSYKLHKKYGKIQINHAHNMFYPFVHNFGDYWWPGEENVFDFGKNPDYFYCEIPLESLQSAYNSNIRGVGTMLLPQVMRATDYFPELRARATDLLKPEQAIRVMTPMLLHDCNISDVQMNNEPVRKWWDIKKAVHISQAKFYGYWFRDALVSSSPKIYGSYYSWEKPSPYRILLIICNLGRTSQRAAIKMDLEKLGISGLQVKYYDLWNGNNELSANEIENREIPANHFMLIGIK